MTLPTIGFSVAFGGTATAIKSYARDRPGFTTMRGATTPSPTGFIASAGALTLTLDNRDRRFDPHYTSGPYYPNLVPNTAGTLTANYAATDYNVFTGTIDEWPQTYPSSGIDQTTPTQAFDAIKKLSEASQVTLTRSAEYTGTRISAILTAIGWPGATSIATGNTIVGAIKANQGSVTAWSHISDCVNAEFGELYIDTDGTLVFRDRSTIATASRSSSSQATYSDTSTTLMYSDIQMTTLPIINECAVTFGPSGETVVESDSTSITAYGRRSLALNLILEDLCQAESYARWIVKRYKDPLNVPLSITFSPHRAESTLFPQVLGRKLCDLITVTRTPKVTGVASAATTTDCWIRGIAHSYADHAWTSTTFYLQEASWITDLFTLGTSALGGSDTLML